MVVTCPECEGDNQVWVADEYYIFTPAISPLGPTAGVNRVIRGGSASDSADACRVAARHYNDPLERDQNIGFRVIRKP